MNSSISVILPAAGMGERFGCCTPKQYCHILHRPLICYTIDSFIRIPWICKIVIVLSSNSIEQIQRYLSSYSREELTRIHLTYGGSSRHKSIYLGLQTLQDALTPPEIIVIHDGVRPIVSENLLERVVDAAKIYGVVAGLIIYSVLSRMDCFLAAGVVRPLVSTVISRNEDSFLENSLDRTKYCASEMPQAFNYTMILESYGKCSEYDLEFGTECLHIAQMYGDVKPKLIMSDEDLWKVTHKKDLYATEGILKENIPVLVKTNDAEKQLLQCLKTTLCKRFKYIKMDNNPSTGKSFENLNQVKFHQTEYLTNIVDEELEHILTNTATVHVVIQPESKMNDHYKILKKIKQHACILRGVSSCIYYICVVDKDLNAETAAEISEVITDLLFNRSLALSGKILYM